MKKNITWLELKERLASVLSDAGFTPDTQACIYGVPRGGCAVAALAVSILGEGSEVVDRPEDATIIVDDLVDSGKTQNDYASRFPATPFIAPFDKRKQDAGVWLVMPWETDEPIGGEDAVRRLLQRIGEDPDREGLKETPARFVKALLELTQGLREDPVAHLAKEFNLQDVDDAPSCYDGMVISKGINIVSLCEHHLLPFTGVVHMVYIPGANGRVVGLSKLARMAEGYARRPQVQERLTRQIGDALQSLQPQGCAVIVKAKHTCQCLRGVKKDGEMVTSAVYGVLKDDASARAEWLALLQI